MPTPYSEIGLQAAANPDKAKRMIVSAFKKAKTHRVDTAAALDIDVATFRRIVERLHMAEELDAIEAEAKENGWHHGRHGGYPLGRPRDTANEKPRTGRPRKVAEKKRSRGNSAAA